MDQPEALRLDYRLVKNRPGLGFGEWNIAKDRPEMRFAREMNAGPAIGFRAIRQPEFHAGSFRCDRNGSLSECRSFRLNRSLSALCLRVQPAYRLIEEIAFASHTIAPI